MEIIDKLINRLGGVTKEQASARANRAMEAAYQDMGEDEPISGTLKRQGYSTLAGGAVKELGGIDYSKVLDTAWKLYLSNPVAKRYLEIKRDYVLGRGIQIQVEDEDLSEIVDEFWQGNQLDGRLKQFALQLFLLGEQLYPVFVRQADGRARIGYIDPAEIEKVICHPENVLEQWAVVLKERQSVTAWEPSYHQRVFRIVRADEGAVIGDEVQAPRYPEKLVTADQAILEEWETALLDAHGLSDYTGSCFYFSVNNVSNQPRGYSDLLQEADWLDQLDSVLFALADREAMADYFSFDVTLEGADEGKISERSRQLRQAPPKKGSVNVHNERETWNMNRPDLKQAGSIESGKTLLTFILGGVGLPRHWYGFGDETNRATAEAQNDPTWRTMEHAQDKVKDMVLSLLTFARDQAEIAGAWRAAEETGEIQVIMPEMTSKDVSRTSQAMSQVASALTMVQSLDLTTRERAAEVWAKLLAELGVEYDPFEELEEVDKQAEEDEIDQAGQFNQLFQSKVNGNEPQMSIEDATA